MISKTLSVDYLNQNILMKRFTNLHLSLMRPILFLFFSISMLSTNMMTAQDVLTPELIAKIQSVTHAVVSGDGEHAAFTLSVPADPFKENKSAENHLYVFSARTDTSI